MLMLSLPSPFSLPPSSHVGKRYDAEWFRQNHPSEFVVSGSEVPRCAGSGVSLVGRDFVEVNGRKYDAEWYIRNNPSARVQMAPQHAPMRSQPTSGSSYGGGGTPSKLTYRQSQW
jgi:hypothetical protein